MAYIFHVNPLLKHACFRSRLEHKKPPGFNAPEFFEANFSQFNDPDIGIKLLNCFQQVCFRGVCKEYLA